MNAVLVFIDTLNATRQALYFYVMNILIFSPSFNLIRFFLDNRFPALFLSVELLDPRMRPLCVALF